jgi:50S ribosomal protein L16 3-hydroxylase
MDDLMVSYAPAGDGVGPHFDNYDVFLVQGFGRRRWQVSHQDDLALIPNLPLKILERFEPQGECVLETGDLLYLPPRWAHDGVAMEPCFTYSVGFRAPDHAQLANAFLEWIADGIHMEGRYADPDLRVTTRPGELPAKMIADSCRLMESLRWNSQSVRDFLGIYLSEPKSHVVFKPPTRPLSKNTFASTLKRNSIRLSANSSMLYEGRNIYINGEHEAIDRRSAFVLSTLADSRTLDGSKVTMVQPLLELLYQWYRAGFIELRQNR